MSQIGAFHIEFSVKGLDEIAAAIAGTHEGLTDLAAAAAGMGTGMAGAQSQAERLGQGAAQLAGGPLETLAASIGETTAGFAQLGQQAAAAVGQVAQLGAGMVLVAGAAQQVAEVSPDDALAKGTTGSLGGLAEVIKLLTAHLGALGKTSGEVAATGKAMANLAAAALPVAIPVTAAREAMQKAAKAAAEQSKAFTRLGDGLKDTFSGIGRALMPATLGLAGWVTAGVMASSSGQILGYQFAELSRQIASLFTPIIRALIDQMGALIRWFQNLSGAQQAGLRYIALFIAGLTAVAFVVPILVGLIKGLIAVFTAMTAAIAAMNFVLLTSPVFLIAAGVAALAAAALAVGVAFLGWERSLKIVGELVSLAATAAADLAHIMGEAFGGEGREAKAFDPGAFLGSMLTGTNFGEGQDGVTASERLSRSVRASMRGLIQPIGQGSRGLLPDLTNLFAPGADMGREELAPRMGGFENVEATYRRIAEASIKIGGGTDKTPAEQAVEELQKIVRSAQTIENEATRFKLPTTR